jgi:hypothetical protein
MNRRAGLFAIAAVLCLVWCKQGEGERCQRDEDCEPLLCVDDDGIGGDGHCCPKCARGEAQWRHFEDDEGGGEWRCTCSSAVETDADADQDVDQPPEDGGGDSGTDAESPPDGDGDADADSEADSETESGPE